VSAFALHYIEDTSVSDSTARRFSLTLEAPSLRCSWVTKGGWECLLSDPVEREA